MARILIVEQDEHMRRELMKLETPFEFFVVGSAERAWTCIEAGLMVDVVVYFADPIAEALLHAAAVDEDRERRASDLELVFERTQFDQAA